MIKKLSFLFLCSPFLFIVAKTITVDRPRGVPLSRKGLYDPNKDFTCLDGSKTISFDWVNDDYCDCKDGSDEPGTSACVEGIFQCINLGHSPVDIPSSRVNDQICDCCDGSDEYSGLVTCPNICEEIGRQARMDAEEKVRVTREGFQKRQELAKEGQRVKEDKKKRLEELKKEKDDLDPQRDELDMKKQDIERQEREAKDKFRDAWKATQSEQKRQQATAAFSDLDANSDRKITVEEIQNRAEFDKDSDGTVSEEEAKDHLGGKEESELDHFIDQIWPNVRHIYKSPDGATTPSPSPIEPTLNTDRLPETPTTPVPPNLDDYEDGDKGDDDEEEEEVKEDEVDDFDSEKYMKDGEKGAPPIEDDEHDMPDFTSDPDLKKLMDDADAVRREYDDVDRKFRDLENDIKKIDEFNEMDLGADSEWGSLQNKCYELNENQYVYKLCLFDRSSQRDKSGGSETSLGNWEKWDGPDDDKYSIQKYTKGQSCWNGPERSTEVVIRCGIETNVVSASEPARCEYRFEMTSPVVCLDPSAAGIHEEL